MICVENKTGKEFAYHFLNDEQIELRDYQGEIIIISYDDWEKDYLKVDKWRQNPYPFDSTRIEKWRNHGIEQ